MSERWSFIVSIMISDILLENLLVIDAVNSSALLSTFVFGVNRSMASFAVNVQPFSQMNGFVRRKEIVFNYWYDAAKTQRFAVRVPIVVKTRNCEKIADVAKCAAAPGCMYCITSIDESQATCSAASNRKGRSLLAPISPTDSKNILSAPRCGICVSGYFTADCDAKFSRSARSHGSSIGLSLTLLAITASLLLAAPQKEGK